MGSLLAATVLMLSIWIGVTPNSVEAATKSVYTISPKTVPVDKKMLKYTTYNSNTKHYYVLRSYLEKLEKKVAERSY